MTPQEAIAQAYENGRARGYEEGVKDGGIFGKLKCWYRRHKVDRRIIRQAKAAGVWNTNAGGRALDLYAKQYRVKRLPGERDTDLRFRIKLVKDRKKLDTSTWNEVTMTKPDEGQ